MKWKRGGGGQPFSLPACLLYLANSGRGAAIQPPAILTRCPLALDGQGLAVSGHRPNAVPAHVTSPLDAHDLLPLGAACGGAGTQVHHKSADDRVNLGT